MRGAARRSNPFDTKDMLATPAAPAPCGETIDLLLAADLQDYLLIASNDLERL